MKVRQFCL